MTEFRIADTFTDSLARLTGDEQKAVKTTAFDLQLNPASPGLQLHKIDKSRDKNFWSVRVSADIRIVVRVLAASLRSIGGSLDYFISTRLLLPGDGLRHEIDHRPACMN